MKGRYKILIALLMFNVLLTMAQRRKDVTENVTDFYSKNDTLPFLKFEKAELDTFINLNMRLPVMAEKYGINYSVWVSFKVDRFGKVNSITQFSSDMMLPEGKIFVRGSDTEDRLRKEYKKETIRLITATESLWYSDSVRENRTIYKKLEYNSLSHDLLSGNNKLLASYDRNRAINNKISLYELGVKKYAIKKTLLAKCYFEQSLQVFPKDIDAHYNLAMCYIKLKNNSKACEHLIKCLELGDKTVEEKIKTYCSN
jgi:tetratricopeptide (TPR) repeat protein